jgi:putative protease
VRWSETASGREVRLNGLLLDRYAAHEPAGYPTLCKGRYLVDGVPRYAIEEPVSLNAMALLPDLVRIGVKAIKIEGRQRGPAYVAEVASVWRAAIDACAADPARFDVEDGWATRLAKLAEGRQVTLGVYERGWR